MKRIVAALAVLSLVAAVLAAPTPAFARPRDHFWGGFAAGALTGVVVGGLFAPRVVYEPAPVYVQPAPVYVAPAPVYVAPLPVCSDYWMPDQWRGSVWVQGHWERYCR